MGLKLLDLVVSKDGCSLILLFCFGYVIWGYIFARRHRRRRDYREDYYGR